MNVRNILFSILALFAALVAGYYFGFKADIFKEHDEAHVSTIMTQIDKVMKLVTVEGQVAEIYDYKNYKTYDLSPFRKKILIRVNAKVLVGYDLDKANITLDEKSKTIHIKNFPNAEILSVDHDLDYYDIQEGTFNKFSEEDLNKLNKEAKEYASQKALTSELYDEAEEQKNNSLKLLEEMLRISGWRLNVVQNRNLIKG